MQSPICDMLGIEFPLLAFSHCRDVVAAVSRAGGMGVLGAVKLSPEELEVELKWIEEHAGGKPYGVDLIVPNKIEGKEGEFSPEQLLAQVPETHKDFVAGILESHHIATDGLEASRRDAVQLTENLRESGSSGLLEVAFAHPIGLIVNALGVPPQIMLELGREHGVPVAALAGTKEHAVRHVLAGVDILIAAGGEAGGHCGEIATMVLVPEVHAAVRPIRDVPILAAGGIVTGRQMAAAMSMGADGAWTGSVWLTTLEAETTPVVKEKMLAAGSRDTVRSRSRTGKYTRQLRSSWTDSWESDEAPAPLPMPLQGLVSAPAMQRIDKLAEGGHEGARALSTYYVGQGVGLMNQALSATAVVQAFKEDFIDACERLARSLGE